MKTVKLSLTANKPNTQVRPSRGRRTIEARNTFLKAFDHIKIIIAGHSNYIINNYS